MREQYDPDKYNAVADRFSSHTYADASRYFRRRLDLLRSLGPRLDPPARVLELACGDGTFGAMVVDNGYAYEGVDASDGMVDASRSKLGDRVRQADFRTYVPAEPVDGTVCWNAFYYAGDRRDVLARIRGYTRAKLVFDFIPREHPVDAVVADVRAAGFENVKLRPFFVPQSYSLLPPMRLALELAEHVGPVARQILRRRFAYVCAAWR